MTEPRILFVTGEYPPLRGGIADYLYLLRQELRSQGTDSIVLSISGSEGKGVSTVPQWGWGVVRNILKLVEYHDIDIVHIQYQTGAFDMHPVVNALPPVFNILSSSSVVTTFHDMRAPYLFPKAGNFRTRLVLQMARYSSVAVVTNSQDKGTLLQTQVHTVQIPVGPSLPKPDRPRSLNYKNTVAYFGFPSREKGIFTLIESIGAICANRRPTLKIIGAPQPDAGNHQFSGMSEIESAAIQHGVTLQRTGFLPPQLASNELNGCQVVAFPFSEGASLRSSALISALNVDRPVVTMVGQDIACLEELRFLPQLVTVPAGDIFGFSAALLDVIEHGREGINLPGRFTWKAIATCHRTMYQSMVSGDAT